MCVSTETMKNNIISKTIYIVQTFLISSTAIESQIYIYTCFCFQIKTWIFDASTSLISSIFSSCRSRCSTCRVHQHCWYRRKSSPVVAKLATAHVMFRAVFQTVFHCGQFLSKNWKSFGWSGEITRCHLANHSIF